MGSCFAAVIHTRSAFAVFSADLPGRRAGVGRKHPIGTGFVGGVIQTTHALPVAVWALIIDAVGLAPG